MLLNSIRIVKISYFRKAYWKEKQVCHFQIFHGNLKNICQRKLFIWYHKYQNNSFLGCRFIVFSQLYYTISGEGLFAFLVTKNAVFMRLMAFCKRLSS